MPFPLLHSFISVTVLVVWLISSPRCPALSIEIPLSYTTQYLWNPIKRHWILPFWKLNNSWNSIPLKTVPTEQTSARLKDQIRTIKQTWLNLLSAISFTILLFSLSTKFTAMTHHLLKNLVPKQLFTIFSIWDLSDVSTGKLQSEQCSLKLSAH